MISRKILNLLFVVAFGAISGCQTIGGFSATSFKQLTSLKAAHVKLIDDFTDYPGNEYDEVKLKNQVDSLDLKFREALEFSKYLKTDLRTANFEILQSILVEDDVPHILKKKRLLTLPEALFLKEPTSSSYDRAAKGECLRPDANCKKN